MKINNINAGRLSILSAGIEEVFCGICSTAGNGKIVIDDVDVDYVAESLSSIKEILVL